MRKTAGRMSEIVSKSRQLIVRFARGYIALLLGLNILLVLLSLGVHVCVLAGACKLYEKYGQILFFFAFGLVFPVAFLAKERNVWKNEFRLSPGWLRTAILGLMIYGAIVAGIQVIFLHGDISLQSNALSGSALPFAFEAMPLSILYSLLYSNSVDEAELINRVRNSVIAMAVCVASLLAVRFGRTYPQK